MVEGRRVLSQFKPDTASKAIAKRHKKEQEEFTSSLRLTSGEVVCGEHPGMLTVDYQKNLLMKTIKKER
jgi:hydrogenase maturation factor HypF (carbamoyltransferase family)